MHATRFVFGFALLLLLVPPVRAGEDDLVTRLYDVGPLLQADRAPAVEVLGLPPGGWELVPEEGDEDEPRAFLEGEVLVDLVVSAVPGGWEEDESALLALEGRQLIVRAREAAHAGVARLLGDLWTEATRRIALEGVHLVFDAEGRKRHAPGGLLDAARTGRADARTRDALLAAARHASAASTVVRPGSRGALGRVRATAYVRDYAVEIAQDSVVGNPVVTTLATGWFVEVAAHVLHDGAILLDGTAQTAALDEPMRRQPLEAEPFGSVDLPTCRVLRFLVGARVVPGESLVATAAPGGERGPLEMLVLTPTLRGERAPRADLCRYDVSALTAMPPRWRLTTSPSEVVPSIDAGALNPPRFASLEPDEPIAQVDDLVEALTTTLGDEVWEREGAWLMTSEQALLVRQDEAVLTAIDRIVADRERVFADEPVVVRLLAVDGDRIETLAEAALRAPHGRAVAWQSGVERAYVADWDVEVAQEARCGDPWVATVFGGLALELRLDPAPVPDRFALTLDLGWTDLDPHMETRRTNNECTGILDIPRTARLDARGDLVLARGETQRIDAGTLEDGRRAVVEVALGR